MRRVNPTTNLYRPENQAVPLEDLDLPLMTKAAKELNKREAGSLAVIGTMFPHQFLILPIALPGNEFYAGSTEVMGRIELDHDVDKLLHGDNLRRGKPYKAKVGDHLSRRVVPADTIGCLLLYYSTVDVGKMQQMASELAGRNPEGLDAAIDAWVAREGRLPIQFRDELSQTSGIQVIENTGAA